MAMYKVIGGGVLTWDELSEVLLDVETQINRRPLRLWKREYLTALRERHNLTHKASKFPPKVGDVVIIKTDNKNRGTWPLAVVTGIYPGKDGIVRAVELKTAHGTLERPTQHLYPLELTCDSAKETATSVPSVQLNPSAPLFRPRRDAAVARELEFRN